MDYTVQNSGRIVPFPWWSSSRSRTYHSGGVGPDRSFKFVMQSLILTLQQFLIFRRYGRRSFLLLLVLVLIVVVFLRQVAPKGPPVHLRGGQQDGIKFVIVVIVVVIFIFLCIFISICLFRVLVVIVSFEIIVKGWRLRQRESSFGSRGGGRRTRWSNLNCNRARTRTSHEGYSGNSGKGCCHVHGNTSHPGQPRQGEYGIILHGSNFCTDSKCPRKRNL